MPKFASTHYPIAEVVNGWYMYLMGPANEPNGTNIMNDNDCVGGIQIVLYA